jgi:hypothetical protein
VSHSYDAWQELLCKHFFTTENSGRPLILFVDDEILDELAGLPNEGASSLAQAVRARLAGEASGVMFERLIRDASLWRACAGDGCPPSLPLLALTVLAASRMARGTHIAPHNYYARLREVLGLSGSGMPVGFGEAMQHLWPQIEWWLDTRHKGTFGRATIAQHPRFTNIGYSLSQALFRRSDRERLAGFFHWLDLKPGATPTSEELVRWFRAWSHRADMSPGVRIMIGDPGHWPQLGEILYIAAVAWDGQLRDESGRRLLPARLALSAYIGVELRFAAERVVGFPESADWIDQSGSEVHLVAANEDWYDPIPITVTPSTLSGWRLLRADQAITFNGQKVMPLRVEPQLTGFVSVNSVSPGVEHWILASNDHAREVETFLNANAVDGWGRDSRLPPGLPDWTLFRDIVIERMPSGVVPPVLRSLVPLIQERPALRGGLQLTGGVYLSGGEPDLWVSDAAAAVHGTECSVDGQLVSVPAAGGTVSLATLTLREGNHVVSLGTARLTFVTMEATGAISAPGTGSIALALRSVDGRLVPADGISTSGSAQEIVEVRGPLLQDPHGVVPAAGAAPVLLPTGASEYVLLGREPGQIDRGRAPGQSSWLKTAGLVPFGVEWTPPFDPVWVLWKTSAGWRCRLRGRVIPLDSPPEGALPDAVKQWTRCIREMEGLVGDEAGLWHLYSAVAEVLDDRPA